MEEISEDDTPRTPEAVDGILPNVCKLFNISAKPINVSANFEFFKFFEFVFNLEQHAKSYRVSSKSKLRIR